MFSLRNTNNNDVELLISYKLFTIYEYASGLDEEEIEKINQYVNDSVLKTLKEYKIIVVDNQDVGTFLVTDYEDGVMLDEVYLEVDYRNRGIGREIIGQILRKHDVVYLWVYKENKRAIKLYRKLGFLIIKETDTRYLMKYTR